MYDESMIIFLADHGEALGEHGVLSHSDNVYDETSRVPLIIKYPKSLELKGRVVKLAELADIFPTITSLLGQKLALDGRNLLGSGANGSMDDSMIVSRTINKCPKYGLRWKNWYYMINFNDNHERLFSLTADPYREIAASHPAITDLLESPFSIMVRPLPQQQRQSCRTLSEKPAGQRY